MFRCLIDAKSDVERVYTNYVGHTSHKGMPEGGQAVVQQLRELLDGQGDRLRDFRSDEAPYELDEVTLTILHPGTFDLHEHQDRVDMLNNLSGVLRVDYGKSSVSFRVISKVGAATSLLSHPGLSALNASLLLFPHHGGGWARSDFVRRDKNPIRPDDCVSGRFHHRHRTHLDGLVRCV